MKTTLLLSSLGIAAIVFAATGLASADDHATAPGTRPSSMKKDIVETALGAGKFGTLAAALKAAKLVDTLKGEGPFTVFAPTDEAFARLPKGAVDGLLAPESRDALVNVLTFHVVSGRVPAAQVVKLGSATALNGQRLPIQVEEAGVRVAGARVVTTDIECSNGVIHVIDTVLMPASKDIVGTAVGAGQFETLAAALTAASLVEPLQGKGPFTVFAPTDAAFAALPKGTVESLLEPASRAKLTSILKFHVVAGRVYSDQLANGEVKTLEGHMLKIRVGKDGAQVGNAKVVKADIETTNGVIHVIDTVLLP